MEQAKALEILKSGRNVFLTGSAGAGKTYVLNQYIQYLKERKVKVAITASTGIAATHMNGMTIHAWSGIGIKNYLDSSDLKRMRNKKYLKDKIEDVKVLIIDEISMLHKNQFNMVQQVVQYFKNNLRAFGGIQIVASGDFFQLPPVGNEHETNRDKFAFMSQAWLDAKFEICYLTAQFRQSDTNLNKILNQIRAQDIDEGIYEVLGETRWNDLGEDPTKLYTHNQDVDSINQEFLSGLESEVYKYVAKTKGNPTLIEILSKSVLTDTELELKEGARVMFIKNNYEAGYINGSVGEITGFYDNEGVTYPVVKLQHGKEIEVVPETWSMDDDQGKPLASFEQVPLRLAWAITIHKSQGMTLDAAEIDLSRTFEKGQGYVALSRLKSLGGLRLKGVNEVALQVDDLAAKADFRFQELSLDASGLNSDELEKESKDFIRISGGLTNPKEIEQHKKKSKEKQDKGSKSTYFITKEYIEEGMSLEEISDIRGVGIGTVVGHLLKVREKYPEVDLERFKPGEQLLKNVSVAVEEIRKEQNAEEKSAPISLKLMYQQLGKKVSYEQIKLALMFR